MTNSCLAEIGLLIYPDCQLSAVYGLTDLFRIASEWSGPKQAGYIRVTHWAQNDQAEITCVWDSHPGAPPQLDYVMTPPSIVMPELMQPMPAEAEWLNARFGQGSRICSICAGAFVLADTGLINGRRVTTHWAFARELAQRYPDVRVDEKDLVLDDGDILSAGGILAWTDLGLTLVERLMGPSSMLATARFLVVEPPRRSQRPFAEFMPQFDHGDDAVLAVQRHIHAHPKDTLRLQDLADKANLGLRTFMRRFSKATSLKPTEYIQHVRVAKAQEALELTNGTVDQIAWDVGYMDTSAFRKIFQRLTGLPPVEYRKRFGVASKHPLTFK